ncbi:DUF4189 domain-containing protein [Shimia marina]|uniref:DUF4189 domain-containing protein n=1 Tax=Shimia marina TaxID=321267 RepID=A0A0P1EV21_9RHOB|nr:DUF4189 domain-containing protein [Shimia marina]CUH54265.1 hypothetical protein SHM7688_03735 [Shimia marina]SFD98947.1 hypothetical protein SAMN04488037_104144 [Shimia marina]
MTRLFLALTLMCVFCLPVSQGKAQDVIIHSNRSVLQQVKDFELKGDAKSGFRQFRRKAEYFGTIYVNRSERLTGSFSNANTKFLADYYARAACHAQSKNPQYCVLYARVLPKDYDPNAQGETLSRDANKEFQEYSRLQNKGRFGAFAASDNGAVGYSWAEASKSAAEKHALKRCAKSARTILRKTPDHLKPAVSSPARQGCRLIHWAD